MTWQDRFEVALAGFGERVHQVSDWHAPTPNTEWDVTDLVKHLINEQQWFPPLVEGLSLDDASKLIGDLGEDLVAEWDAYAATSVKAARHASDDVTVHLSYGDVTLEHYVREMTTDALIHSWDLARAIGASENLDEALVAAVYEHLEPQAEGLAATGLFAAPIPVPEDAWLQDKLIALTGRTP